MFACGWWSCAIQKLEAPTWKAWTHIIFKLFRVIILFHFHQFFLKPWPKPYLNPFQLPLVAQAKLSSHASMGLAFQKVTWKTMLLPDRQTLNVQVWSGLIIIIIIPKNITLPQPLLRILITCTFDKMKLHLNYWYTMNSAGFALKSRGEFKFQKKAANVRNLKRDALQWSAMYFLEI